MTKEPFREIETISLLNDLMNSKGVTSLYVKKLAPNDNSKNQIYIGGNFDVLNIIPFGDVSTDKSRKDSKRDRYKAPLNFSWVDNSGNLYEAADAQLILYPKYPEVRVSGFLKGCQEAPSEAMANRYEGRLLFLGITDAGKIIGHATLPDNPISKELDALTDLEEEGVFLKLPLHEGDTAYANRQKLINDLRNIHLEGWIDSVKLCKDGSLAPCRSSNCGGYTLEALLGITPNGYAEPDYLGWELKQHGVRSLDKPHSGGAITLMTPEPTGGVYKNDGSETFIRRFGYPDKNGVPDRLNFGGIYKADKYTEITELTLQLSGYDSENKKIEDINGGITLVTDEGEEAAIWHYSGILEHWNRKHAQAAYIPSSCIKEPTRQYKYGNLIELGTGTNFSKFLEAVSIGSVYLGPALKLEHASSDTPKKKCRNQFRIRPKELSSLYKEFETVDLMESS